MIGGFSKEDLQRFTLPILKRIALYYNLDKSGRKDVLIERICTYQGNLFAEDQAQAGVQMSVRVRRIMEASNEIR